MTYEEAKSLSVSNDQGLTYDIDEWLDRKVNMQTYYSRAVTSYYIAGSVVFMIRGMGTWSFVRLDKVPEIDRRVPLSDSSKMVKIKRWPKTQSRKEAVLNRLGFSKVQISTNKFLIRTGAKPA